MSTEKQPQDKTLPRRLFFDRMLECAKNKVYRFRFSVNSTDSLALKCRHKSRLFQQ